MSKQRAAPFPIEGCGTQLKFLLTHEPATITSFGTLELSTNGLNISVGCAQLHVTLDFTSMSSAWPFQYFYGTSGLKQRFPFSFLHNQRLIRMKSSSESVQPRVCLSDSDHNSRNLSAGFYAGLQEKLRGLTIVIVICEMHDPNDRSNANSCG